MQDGRIELMQNRRINKDDWRGMGDPLNEVDSNGNGITVPATYYVQLFNQAKRPALQRIVQQRVDQPQQQFFAFNPVQSGPVSGMNIPRIVTDGFDKILAMTGFTSEMKLELFPLARNTIMMRVENIADIFNSGHIVYQMVDIDLLASSIFELANGYSIGHDLISIEETSLTGN